MASLFLALLFTGIPCSTGLPVFTRRPEEKVFRMVGSDLVLEWNYSDKTGELNTIVWKARNTTDGIFYPLILVDGTGNLQPNPLIPAAYVGRVEFRRPATLVVKSVTFEDSTRFSCTMSTVSVQAESDELQVSVTGKASVDHLIQTGNAGDPVTFTCSATNIPSDNFTWMRYEEKEKIVSDARHSVVSVDGSSQLTLKSLDNDNDGYYTCTAAVNADEPSDTHVFVQLLSNLTEVKDDAPCPKRFYTVSGNETLLICCPVAGYPPPIVTWEKNGIQLQKGENIYLTITPMKDEDFGNYTCTATNLETSLGPFSISVKKESAEQPVNPTEGTPERAPKLEWSRQAGAKFYAVEINGTDILDDFVCGTKRSLEFYYNQFVFKNPEKKPDQINICANVKAIGDERIVGKTSKCQKFTVKSNSAA